MKEGKKQPTIQTIYSYYYVRCVHISKQQELHQLNGKHFKCKTDRINK